MAKRKKLLNVREHLEWVELTCIDMLNRDEKFEGGLKLAPIDVDNLNKLRLVTQAIIKNHDKQILKGQRKDIYVQTKT